MAWDPSAAWLQRALRAAGQQSRQTGPGCFSSWGFQLIRSHFSSISISEIAAKAKIDIPKAKEK